MAQCQGTKRSGEQCTLPATGPGGYCWAHDPARADERRRNASRAAKSNRRNQPMREVQDVKHRLLDLAEAVLDGRVERDLAIAAGQLLNGALRALEVERRWRVDDELEQRISELEQIAGPQNRSGGSWHR
jgi:hypothetical protein